MVYQPAGGWVCCPLRGQGEWFLFVTPGTSRPRTPRVLLSHDKSTQKRARTKVLDSFGIAQRAILYVFVDWHNLVLRSPDGADQNPPAFCVYPRVLTVDFAAAPLLELAYSLRHDCAGQRDRLPQNATCSALNLHRWGKQCKGLAPNGYTNSTPKGQQRLRRAEAGTGIGPGHQFRRTVKGLS